MNKQIISFTANEQELVRNGGECHYSSNKVSYIEAVFDLGTNWDSFDSVRAIWFTDFVNGISTVLDADGTCIVPSEVLKRKCKVNVNLVGSIVENDVLTDRLTSYPITALVVDANAKVESTETAQITPSQFDQFVSIVRDAVANIKDIVSTTLNADYTLTFVYSDGTSYTTPSIRGERGPQGADGADGTDGNGIASAVLNSNYTLTLTFTDGTSYTTPSIRGAQGPKGDPGDVSQAQLDAAVSDLKSEISFINSSSYNMIDVSKVDDGIRYSAGETKLIASVLEIVSTPLIEVEEGKTYTVSGTSIGSFYQGGYFAKTAKLQIGQTALSNITLEADDSGTGKKFTVPTGQNIGFVAFNLATSDSRHTIIGTYQMERGSTATVIRPYHAIYGFDDTLLITDNYTDNSVTPAKIPIFDTYSHNLINPDDIDFDIYWSPSQQKLVTSSSGTKIATTGFIEVEEGETYCLSGTARSSGGYFADGTAKAVDVVGTSITYFSPVSGDGECFTVPSGYKYVCFNLNTNNDKTAIDGTYQLEKGEMPTPITPYELKYVIKSEFLPNESSSDNDELDILPMPSYSFEYDKISNFMAHHMAKDQDLMIVGTGTSLTARSSEHCTLRSDATSRPPLMHSNNFASKIWDRIKWDGQQYRRFDYPSFFTETGTFTSSADNSNWDDANYRYGITRFASGSASVAFTVPEEAWQFNFIYRTDTSGSESVSVAISEGNGKMEVWNGSAWVEANGYTFSMKETAITLSNIEVCNPNTINNSKVSQSSYQVGGNTTYQKRLKMRCKSSLINSIGETKAVTISSSSGRLLYWGVEWSPREFMITYVNSARGSHNIYYNDSLSLFKFQDNEIWSFKPNLIFTENPIHNSGGSGYDLTPYYTTYWGYATDDFFFNTDNPISLASRAIANNVTGLEWIVFTSSISWNFNGIDNNGELKLYTDKSGNVLTALDAQTLCHKWILDNEPDVISINACKYWCDAGKKLFGDLKTATVGSGKNGKTFTNEGSHWNDTGSAVIDRCVGGVFDFYN